MEKRYLAKKRNYFKYVLTGIPKPIDIEVLSERERLLWNDLLTIRNTLISEFNKNSKLMGLNVPEKCWCGKKLRKTPCEKEHCGKSLSGIKNNL